MYEISAFLRILTFFAIFGPLSPQ